MPPSVIYLFPFLHTGTAFMVIVQFRGRLVRQYRELRILHVHVYHCTMCTRHPGLVSLDLSSVRKMATKNRCSGRAAVFSAQRPRVAQNSEYLLKVCCLGMANMKSGSLTPKDLHFLCLRPGDLKNGYFALFCRNCRCAQLIFGLKILHVP